MCQLRKENATPDLKSRVDVVRAWKDESYRLSLSDAERALLPANPAGLIELSDLDLDYAVGGLLGQCGCSGCCSHGSCPALA